MIAELKSQTKNILMNADSTTRDLVGRIIEVLSDKNLNLIELKNGMICLLEYLSSPEGRTDINCKAVDSFFMSDDLWLECDLPSEFHDIFADMSGTLHDTMSAPEIAANFESTPEQLLKRTMELNTEP